jgi:O-antigen ligase
LKIFFDNPFPWWDYTDFQYNPNRLSSTFDNANHLAGYMAMSIPLSLGFILFELKGAKRSLIFGLFLLMCIALILSQSRGGWVASIFGLAFMISVILTHWYYIKKRIVVFLTPGILVLLIMALYSTSAVERIRTFEKKENIPSFKARVIVWGGAIDVIKDHPIIGTGPGTFSTVFTQYQPPGFTFRSLWADNDYLHFISELGVALVIVIIWMIVGFYRRGFKKIKHPNRFIKGTIIGAMSGITAILFHSIVDFNLHIPANALLFTILCAIIVSPVHKHEAPQSKPTPITNNL